MSLNRTHSHKALLTFTREELRILIDALDSLRPLDRMREVGDHEVLRARIVYAADSLPPVRT